jgi:hypothetical protein
MAIMEVTKKSQVEMERIAKLIKEAEEDRKDGKTKVYNDVSEAFKDMGINMDEL